jgi:hypothetical protein
LFDIKQMEADYEVLKQHINKYDELMTIETNKLDQ